MGYGMRKVAAFIKKEFLTEVSYRFALAWEVLSILFPVLTFFFLSKLLGGAGSDHLSKYGTDYFSFVLVGLAFSNYLGVGLGSFSGNLRREQMLGTLEGIFSTPTKASTIILSLSAWNFLYATVQVAIFFGLGKMLGVSFANARWDSVIVIFILTLISLSGLGIFSASFIMIFKRGDPVSWLVGNTFDLAGGVYFPVAILPTFLQTLSRFLPITYALRGLRLALFQKYTLAMLLPEIVFLSVFSAIAFPSSLLFFGYAVRKAKEKASLNQY